MFDMVVPTARLLTIHHLLFLHCHIAFRVRGLHTIFTKTLFYAAKITVQHILQGFLFSGFQSLISMDTLHWFYIIQQIQSQACIVHTLAVNWDFPSSN